jgi:hypothetical protein
MLMRRAIFILLVFGMGAGTVLGQSITVTKPANGETWVQGQTCAITWTKSGTMPALVKISLKEANSPTIVLEIVDGAPNSGSYSWLLPASVAPGQYKIRVKVKNSTVVDDSGTFTIAAAAPAPAITVTAPAAGAKWSRTKPYAVTWAKTGTLPGTVKIDLYDKNGIAVVAAIAASAPNNGSYSWTIPGDAALGEFRVKVKANGAAVEDTSDEFQIALPGLNPGFAGTKAAVQKKPDLHIAPGDAAATTDVEVVKVGAWCTNWSRFTHMGNPIILNQISQARPIPCRGKGGNDFALVGYDHFWASWPNSNGNTVSGWLHDYYRSKVYFFIDDLMGRKARFLEAKAHFKQIDSVKVNTSHASCATGMAILRGMWTDWWNPPVTTAPVGLPFMDDEFKVDVTDIVRRWLDGDEVNYGFFLNTEKEYDAQEAMTCYSCYEISLELKFKKLN